MQYDMLDANTITIHSVRSMTCCKDTEPRTLASASLCEGSFNCASSAAALLTETAPDAIVVSDRTRLPAVMACR